MKKWFALGLSCALLASAAMLVTACDKKPEEPAKEDDTTKTEQPTGPEGTALGTAAELAGAFDEDGKYYLSDNINVTNTVIDVTANVTLELNGKTLTSVFNAEHEVSTNPGTGSSTKNRAESYVFYVHNGASLTVNAENGGKVVGTWTEELARDEDVDKENGDRTLAGYIFQVGMVMKGDATEPAATSLTINGGEYVSTDSPELVNHHWGTTTVNGGKFTMNFSDTDGGNLLKDVYGSTMLLNRADFGNSRYSGLNLSKEQYDAKVKIVVKGGSFKDFDPANMGKDFDKPTKYVAEGYTSAEGTGELAGWFTVTKNA